jgi:hypothetical protein
MAILAAPAFEETTLTIGGLAVIIGLIYGVIKATIITRTWVETTNEASVTPIAEQLAGVSEQLRSLSAVVGRNGGSTIHTRLDGLTQNIAEVTEKVQSIDEHVAVISDRQTDAAIFARFVTHAIPPYPIETVMQLVEYWRVRAGELAVDEVTAND